MREIAHLSFHLPPPRSPAGCGREPALFRPPCSQGRRCLHTSPGRGPLRKRLPRGVFANGIPERRAGRRAGRPALGHPVNVFPRLFSNLGFKHVNISIGKGICNLVLFFSCLFPLHRQYARSIQLSPAPEKTMSRQNVIKPVAPKYMCKDLRLLTAFGSRCVGCRALGGRWAGAGRALGSAVRVCFSLLQLSEATLVPQPLQSWPGEVIFLQNLKSLFIPQCVPSPGSQV